MTLHELFRANASEQRGLRLDVAAIIGEELALADGQESETLYSSTVFDADHFPSETFCAFLSICSVGCWSTADHSCIERLRVPVPFFSLPTSSQFAVRFSLGFLSRYLYSSELTSYHGILQICILGFMHCMPSVAAFPMFGVESPFMQASKQSIQCTRVRLCVSTNKLACLLLLSIFQRLNCDISTDHAGSLALRPRQGPSPGARPTGRRAVVLVCWWVWIGL